MSKELEALYKLSGLARDEYPNSSVEPLCLTIETALKEKEENDFELEVFKLAYEWKCKGVKGTYEEVLNQARKTVESWKEIAKKGYGTIIAD